MSPPPLTPSGGKHKKPKKPQNMTATYYTKTTSEKEAQDICGTLINGGVVQRQGEEWLVFQLVEEKNLQNLICAEVRYLGPTNHKGSRIKVSLPRFETSKTISYRYEGRDAEEGAVAWLRENGVEPVARACGRDHVALLLISFDDVAKLETLFSI